MAASSLAPESDHPNVRFPPPLLYLGVVAAGFLLGRRWPLPLPGAAASRIVGTAAVVAGAGLMLIAVQRFRRHATSLVPIRPASHFVADGPYRFTRNPMYLGLTAVTAGAGLLLGNAWVLALLVPAAVIADVAFVRPEEHYLDRRFGEDYRAYRTAVRRWI